MNASRRLLVVTFGALAAVACPSVAGAADAPLPGADSAIRQYIEMVPTAAGSVAAGSGTRTTEIPAATKQQIEQRGGDDADLLTKVVSSEAYGAPSQFQAPTPPTTQAPTKQQPRPPTRVRPQTPGRTSVPVLPAAPLPDAPNPVSAAFGSVGLSGLLFALALVGAAALAALPRLTRS